MNTFSEFLLCLGFTIFAGVILYLVGVPLCGFFKHPEIPLFFKFLAIGFLLCLSGAIIKEITEK